MAKSRSKTVGSANKRIGKSKGKVSRYFAKGKPANNRKAQRQARKKSSGLRRVAQHRPTFLFDASPEEIAKSGRTDLRRRKPITVEHDPIAAEARIIVQLARVVAKIQELSA